MILHAQKEQRKVGDDYSQHIYILGMGSEKIGEFRNTYKVLSIACLPQTQRPSPKESCVSVALVETHHESII